MTVLAKVAGSDPSGVVVQVPIGATGRASLGERETVQRIAIQRDGIQRLDLRQLAKSRTYLAAAGSGAAIIAFVVAFSCGSGSGGQTSEPVYKVQSWRTRFLCHVSQPIDRPQDPSSTTRASDS